jgi:hypothetical protein
MQVNSIAMESLKFTSALSKTVKQVAIPKKGRGYAYLPEF